jgi:putative hydrolase of the HAD superfamily
VSSNGRAAVVLFDFGGTLDADGIPWARRFHQGYVDAGGRLDFAAFEPLFQASDDALLRLHNIRQLGYRATLEAQVRCLRPLVPEGDGLDGPKMVESFHAAALGTVERNRPILERLKRTYRLGIVSNFTGNLAPCLDELGLASYFTVVSDSTVVGVEKPDARIFVATLDALGALPDQAWMVGDNFEADIRPATRLGLRACWIAPPGRVAASDAPPHVRVAALPELLEVLA